MKTISPLPNDFYVAKNLLYDKIGYEISEINPDKESREYGACDYKLNGLNIKFRVAKITPKKTGQFVTIWKRNNQGITGPFDETDDIDFIIVSCRDNDQLGQFVFPKSVLIEKGIIKGKSKAGKRGFRVYPPWDKTTNQQAIKTQHWQLKYFLIIHQNCSTDIDLIMQLFTNSLELTVN